FVERVDLKAVNRRVIESLIKCGSLDFSGVTRREMVEQLDEVLKWGQAAQRDKDTNQISLFGGPSYQPGVPRRRLNKPEWPINQKLMYEREALGLYISGHPLEKFRRDLRRMGAISTTDAKGSSRQSEVRIGGVVTALKLKNTKKGDRYATFSLEDWLGSIEA